MDNIFVYAIIALLAVLIILVLVLLLRRPKAAPQKEDNSAVLEEVRSQFRTLNTLSLSALSQVSSNTREELSGMRDSLSSQLSALFTSMGEFKNVSKDISELKTALAGNKSRGNWGEARLASILADNLSPSQYTAQCALSYSGERVDFAVSLPGERDVYLPIDSKFPLENFSAYLETGDAQPLRRAVAEQAKSIAKKYILPPDTTDFAIMFVPSESLYLALSELDMPSVLSREYRVIPAGPSVLSAMLSSVSLILGTYSLNARTDEILAAFQQAAQSLAAIESELSLAQKSVSSAEAHITKAAKSARKLALALEDTERL